MCAQRKGVAFITGATSGIGAAFAEEFASQGLDLVITGRRREKIQALADEIAARRGVDVQVLIAELSDHEHLDMVVETARSIRNLDVLVNNAGFAQRGRFHELDRASHKTMLDVHATTTMCLTCAALPAMISNGKGVIINVSSIAAFFPLAGNAMYSATKAFVNFLTEAIHLELRGTGVRVQALCPGLTRTDFHAKMGLDPEEVYRKKGLWRAMTPPEVVECSLRCLAKDQVICVPGFKNQFTSFLPGILPRWLVHKVILSMRKD
jgi:short-subunit dehydrogenase